MITIGMNYHVIPCKENKFKPAFEGVANALSDAEGYKKSRLYSDCIEPHKFLIISEWSNQEAFQAFIGSEAFRKVANWGAGEMLLGRPTHKVD